jgi:hypothetical protein
VLAPKAIGAVVTDDKGSVAANALAAPDLVRQTDPDALPVDRRNRPPKLLVAILAR